MEEWEEWDELPGSQGEVFSGEGTRERRGSEADSVRGVHGLPAPLPQYIVLQRANQNGQNS